MVKEELNDTVTNNGTVAKRPEPENKDRTLFCINIDQRCTEDILYELFLQAGPLENIIRKEDRNGNLICLIIYKHIESCDYAIKLFNGITLFNTSLKVQQSQAGGQGQQQKRPVPSQNNYANLNERNDRDRNRLDRRMSYEQQNMSPSSPSTPSMRPPQQSLTNLMAQQFSQTTEFGTHGSNQYMNPYSDTINRSISGSNLNFDSNQNDYQQHHSRRSFNNNMNQNGRHNSRGYSNDNRNDQRRSYDGGFQNQNNQQQNNFQRNRSQHGNKNERNDDRSRSPQRKRNRY